MALPAEHAFEFYRICMEEYHKREEKKVVMTLPMKEDYERIALYAVELGKMLERWKADWEAQRPREKSDCGWKSSINNSYWMSGCGEELVLEKDSTPHDCCMSFCPFCGGKLIAEED